MTKRGKSKAFAVVAVVVLLAFSASNADAKRNKPADKFAGKIITSSKRIPTRAKSPNAYISKLRKARKTKFHEDKESKTWKVYFGAFFRKPLRSVEVQIKLYDISGGSRKLVTVFEQYLAERGMRSYISSVVLERDTFGVNRHIEMVVEDSGRAVAKSRFKILGEGPKYTGNVDFSDDDDGKSKKKRKKPKK